MQSSSGKALWRRRGAAARRSAEIARGKTIKDVSYAFGDASTSVRSRTAPSPLPYVINPNPERSTVQTQAAEAAGLPPKARRNFVKQEPVVDSARAFCVIFNRLPSALSVMAYRIQFL